MFTLVVVYLLILNIDASMQGYWWTVGNVDLRLVSPPSIMSMYRFSRTQRFLVQTTPNLLEGVGRGAALAIKECQQQFQNRKWNCSSYSAQSVFGKVLNRACRETAFIHGITSAGVTYSLTESCEKGHLRCHCQSERLSKQSDQKYMYDGCKDSIRFGYQKSKEFVDAKETGRDFHSIVNLWNNEAGRLTVVDSMKMRCTCHGVSGNCNIQTCKKVLPAFNFIGEKLKNSYDLARKVVTKQISGNTRISRNHLGSIDNEDKIPNRKELVYFQDSPNFCEHNLKDGTLGTKGRYCNATSTKSTTVDGCEDLCCGRSWKTEMLTRMERCKCIFKFCCEVICQQCEVTRRYSYCE